MIEPTLGRAAVWAVYVLTSDRRTFAAGRLITFRVSALLCVQSSKGHGQRETASMLLCPICERYFV